MGAARGAGRAITRGGPVRTQPSIRPGAGTPQPDDRAANRIEDYRALGRTEPLSAFALAFALACLAGLPPGLLGLFAKVVVFQAPVENGAGWLVAVMAVNVVVGLYYYLAWAATMYARPEDEARPPAYRISWSDGLAIGITLGAALLLSIVPDTILRFD